MEFTTGTYIAIAAVLFFYFRLIVLQRQKAKHGQQARAASKTEKKSRKTGAAAQAPYRPVIVVSNKVFVILGVALLLLGAVIAFLDGLAPAVRNAWWLPVTAGILLMSLGIR